MIVMTITACDSRPTKVVRSAELFFSNSKMAYVQLEGVSIISVDTLFRVGDTISYNGSVYVIVP